MIYLLIDNCSLRDLIDPYGYGKFLTTLENLILAEKISFVTHQVVIEEWNKHKNGFRKEKEMKLLGISKKNKAAAQNTSSLLPSMGLISTSHIAVQTEVIDRLLQNAKLTLETPDIISAEFAGRLKKRLAPFHIKRDSLNDWEIFGSYCHHCEINGIKELYFLSANIGEFAEPGTNQVHPDLSSRFPRVVIHYFTDWNKALEAIDKPYGLPAALIPYTIKANTRYSFKASLQKNVLDGLYHLYTNLYEEIAFIPTHLLTRYYPFASSETQRAYYSHFAIQFAPEALTDFLNNITIGKKSIHFNDESLVKSITNYQAKTETVLKKLTLNMVFHIQSEESHRTIRTHYYTAERCDCFQCCADRFELKKAFENIKAEQSSYRERLKQAYVYYQWGYLHEANAIYDGITNSALKDLKFISYFIAKYNQRHLANFLSNLLLYRETDEVLVERLKQIDPIEEAVKLKSHTDYNLLLFIAQEDFFNDAFQGITETVQLIVEAYKSQLDGGWGTNNHITTLTEKFVRVEAFLNSNFIIYDRFLNFEKLFSIVNEGIFAAHAITGTRMARLEKFDDYWVGRLMVYGDHKKMKSLFEDYNLKTLSYTPTGQNGDTFLEAFTNLVEFTVNAIPGDTEDDEQQNRFLSKRTESILSNCTILAALLELDKKSLEHIARLLLSIINSRQRVSHTNYTSMTYFFERKGKLLRQQTKLAFIKTAVTHPKDCEAYFTESVIGSMNTREIEKISDAIFQQLVAQSLEKCNYCNRKHVIDPVTALYTLSSAARKKIISNKINASLSLNFDFRLFYMGAIFSVIDHSEKQIKALIKQFKNDPARPRRTFIGEPEDQNSYLDQVINLCFKYRIDTKGPRFREIASFSPYYKWLLNMDGFNYKNFKPEWVLAYRTKHYYKAMSQSMPLIKALKKHLAYTSHEGLERVLLRITHFVD